MDVTGWSIRHSVTVLVLIVVLTLAGLMAYQGLPREAAPDVTIPFVLVSTPYVGVSPSDIEKLVTNPLEDELQQLKDVRTMSSTSADGVSIVTIEFEPDVDINNAIQKVRERVDSATPFLPTDLTEEPTVSEISFSEFPIMIINISGNVGLAQLKHSAEEMQDRLERISGVLEVKIVGGVEREIRVEADPRLLTFYNVGLDEVVNAIRKENLNLPGGSMNLGELRYPVRVPGEFRAVSEIADVVIREEDGEPIHIGEVAEVVDSFEEQTTHSRVNGLESLSISLTRRAGENILRIADEAKAIVAEFEEIEGGRIRYSIVGDVSKDIHSQVEELENNILTGLILVAGVLLFFMGGLRNALFVAVAIPLSMLISFGILATLDITLNIVVLFALVLALGMLVDNAIVIVENIYRHGHMNKTLVEAALDGTREVAWPVIASTATTVFAFVPLMFWPGIMGEFMYYLPLTVVVVLTASLFVALVINPVLCALFMRVKKHHDFGSDELAALPKNIIYRLYGGTLRFSLRHRWLVGLGVLLTFIATFWAYSKLNAGTQFFPETTPQRVYVNVSLPDGSNLESSNRVVLAAERELFDKGNVARFVSDVGAGNGGQMIMGKGNSPHRSRITVEFLEEGERIEDPFLTVEAIRQGVSSIVGAEIEVIKAGMGPPTGPPINVELVGDDYAELGRLAEELKRTIADVPNVVNLKDSFEAGRAEITVRVDDKAAASVKLSTQEVANAVRMAVSGVQASVLRDEAEDYDIIVRLAETARDSIEDIKELSLKSRDKVMVPITEVARVQVERGFGSIRHIDGDRVVTVSAEAIDASKADTALQDVKQRLREGFELPAGYDMRYTGQNKDQQEAQDFLGKALLAALFLIALVLVTQFNSVMQPFIILGSVVLSLLGVLWMLMLRQMPFGIIMTGVGVISLAGVVVNNSIVLIDYINQLKERGMTSAEAVYQAGMVRFRPVMLTAVTTVLSLMPIVLGFSLDVKNLQVVFGGRSVEMWGPMANAVVGGLTVATALTLIVVPVLYSWVDSSKAQLSRFASWVVALFRRRPAALPLEEAQLARETDAEAPGAPAGSPEPALS